MIIGVLVPRPCQKRSVATCSNCNGRYCEEHIDIAENGILCDACRTGEEMKTPVDPLPADLGTFKQGDYDLFDEPADKESDYASTTALKNAGVGLLSSLGSSNMFDDLS